jgi:hypothetical protein
MAKNYGSTGTFVDYISERGNIKPALVLGTPETLVNGGLEGSIDGTQRRLLVFSPKTGQAYLREVVDSRTEEGQTRVWA